VSRESEFSRRIEVSELQGEAREFEIAANAAERESLAERFDLVALERLEASVRVAPMGSNDIVRVSGRFSADVVQSCVITLDEIPGAITGEFDRLFAAPYLCVQDSVVEIDVASEDPPDPIRDGSIDIGEVVAEHMGLGLNPFPRAPGAEFNSTLTQERDADGAIETRKNPFAILERLKDR
jgi:uncharacterized metal-binding protein YceD (DUF177 family)